jgi:hypothetical protein
LSIRIQLQKTKYGQTCGIAKSWNLAINISAFQPELLNGPHDNPLLLIVGPLIEHHVGHDVDRYNSTSSLNE